MPDVSVAGIVLTHGMNATLVRRWIVREQRRESVALAVPLYTLFAAVTAGVRLMAVIAAVVVAVVVASV